MACKVIVVDILTTDKAHLHVYTCDGCGTTTYDAANARPITDSEWAGLDTPPIHTLGWVHIDRAVSMEPPFNSTALDLCAACWKKIDPFLILAGT